jgi:hypothetical protein
MENVSTTMSNLGELAKALSAAQGELSTALKTSTNPHFKSKFADLSEVWDACRAALSKYKIAVIQCPQFDEKCDYLETTLVHESGQYMTSRIVLKNAKGDMQGLGSSLTYSRRYALAAMVGVTAEDDDGNAASFKEAPQVIRQANAIPVPGFDPNNKAHRDKLSAECLKRKIFGDHQANLFAAMKGKPFSELDKLIVLTNPEKDGEL